MKSLAHIFLALFIVAAACTIGVSQVSADGNAGRINGLVQSELGSCLAAWEVAGYSIEQHDFGLENYASFVFHAIDADGNHVLGENGFPLNIAQMAVAWAGKDYWVVYSTCLPAP